MKKYLLLNTLVLIILQSEAQNTWLQKASMSAARQGAVGFSIGTKGYIGTGWDGPGNYKLDFWEWNQSTNTWSQKANFGGAARFHAVGFAAGGKGYIGTGENGSGSLQDFWEYDPTSNTWTAKANFGGGMRRLA